MTNSANILAGLLAAIINVSAALLLGAILILAVGENPIDAYAVVFSGAFGNLNGLSYTIHYATNFLLSGLGFAVAAHARQFNIGGEGQAYVGGLGVTLVCLAMPGVPWFAALPIAIAAAGLFGAAWAYVPAMMLIKRGSHVVITTIMFNFLASLLMIYLIVNVLRPKSSMIPASAAIDPSLSLPKLDEILGMLGIAATPSPLNITAIVALVLAGTVVWLIWFTRWGYELRAVGQNADAAAFAGIPVNRIIVQAMCLSGGLIGLIGVNEIMGSQHRLMLDFAFGYGFGGIAVALIGANHPIGIVLASILFGALNQGGASLSFLFPSVSIDVVVVLQGLVILFAGGLIDMLRARLSGVIEAVGKRGKSANAGEQQ